MARGYKPIDRPVARAGDYEFKECDSQERQAARDLVRQFHYTRGMSNTGKFFCAKRNGIVVGAAVYIPPLLAAAVKHAQGDPKMVISLSRLVVATGEPQNVAGMLIAASLRLLVAQGKYDTIVTYADMSEGHTGTVYRATNAQSCGVSKPSAYWIDPETGRRVSQQSKRRRSNERMLMLGYERRTSPGKYCFKWMFDRRGRLVQPKQ